MQRSDAIHHILDASRPADPVDSGIGNIESVLSDQFYSYFDGDEPTKLGLIRAIGAQTVAALRTANVQGLYEKLWKERDYQQTLWTNDEHLTVEVWLLILESELGKVKEKYMEYMFRYSPERRHTYSWDGSYQERLVKLAAVCVAALENLT